MVCSQAMRVWDVAVQVGAGGMQAAGRHGCPGGGPHAAAGRVGAARTPGAVQVLRRRGGRRATQRPLPEARTASSILLKASQLCCLTPKPALEFPEVPLLYSTKAQSCEDTLKQVRFRRAEEALVSHRFIAALTRGGAGGMPRPIEMHAHDPRRFISDMLAWVHQVGRYCPPALRFLSSPTYL